LKPGPAFVNYRHSRIAHHFNGRNEVIFHNDIHRAYGWGAGSIDQGYTPDDKLLKGPFTLLGMKKYRNKEEERQGISEPGVHKLLVLIVK